MPALTIKKPRFVGVNAALIEADATFGKDFKNLAAKNSAARKAVADTYKGAPVYLVKVKGERFVVLDELPDIPEFSEVEGAAKILWVGEKGEIIVTI